MKKVVKLISLIIMLVMSLTTFAAEDASDNKSDSRNQTVNLYADVNLVSTTKIEYGKPRIVIKAVYPELQSADPNQIITDFNELVAQLIKKEIAAYTDKVKTNRSLQINLPKASVRNNLYIDFDTSVVKSGDDRIISVRFSIQGIITGVSTPYHIHRVLNYDLYTGEEVQLSDLFMPDANYLDAFTNYTTGVLYKRLREKQMIMQGTQPTPDNFQNWNIKPNGILITFDEAQVAPTIEGAQTVLIPYEYLEQVLAPDSVIFYCVSHGKRCRNSNILTGGFIDQAINTYHRPFDPILSPV